MAKVNRSFCIVRSIDILQKKEYNYQYEDGKVVRAIENNIEVNDTEMIVGIATINPYRYRGYFFDKETGLYYLQSRYYNASVGRFVNGDLLFDAKILLFNNIYCYCNNNSINNIDSNGNSPLLAAAGGVAAAGATNGWNPLGWALIVIAVVIAVVGMCAVIIEAANSNSIQLTKKKSNKKILADVKVKTQYGKKYQLAYISKQEELIKFYEKYSFAEALMLLGITGATNSISQRFVYDRGRSSEAQRKLQHQGKGDWGIYTSSQYAAKALAVVLGGSEPPEIHGAGMYGHYHDSTHTFHIWYGGKINKY